MSENIIFQFNSDIAKGNDSVRIAFYANIGFFIEVAQMLEFNLRKLICYHLSVIDIEAGEINKENIIAICQKYDEYYLKTYSDKLTLGQLVVRLEQIGVLKEAISLIREVNEYRVLVVHKLFQNNLEAQRLQEAKYVSAYTEKRLVPMINKAIMTNELILKTIALYREDLHDYKKRFDIPVNEN